MYVATQLYRLFNYFPYKLMLFSPRAVIDSRHQMSHPGVATVYAHSVYMRLVRATPLGGAPSPCNLTYLSKPDRGDIGAPKRVADHPASLYHSNISLEMIILPFFHDNFLFPSIFSIIGGYIPVIMIISINYYD